MISPHVKRQKPKDKGVQRHIFPRPFLLSRKITLVKQCYINISKAQIQESLCNVIVILQRKNVVYNRNIRGT